MQTEAARGPAFSLGAVLLDEEMQARDLSRADVGRAIKAGRHMVCRWLSGQRPISLRYAVKVEALYGVPVPAWTQAPPKRRNSRKSS